MQAGQVTNGAIVEGKGEALPDEEIWARDVRWLEEIAAADGAIVAEVTIPSLGVGYELALARWRFGIPVVAMHRPGPGRRCSAMIAGDPEIQIVPYGEEELEAALDRVAGLLAI